MLYKWKQPELFCTQLLRASLRSIERLHTIENQLMKKNMAAENSRSGALLVPLANDRKWNHPDTRGKINVDELFTLLRSEAERVQEAMGVAIAVHFLDLRPRLLLENDQKKKNETRKHSKTSECPDQTGL